MRVVRFGPFALDSVRRQLTREGREVHLTPKAYALLALLVAESPRVMPKGELHDRLWPGTFVSDATLAGLVKELRRALDDRDPRTPIIRTAHGVGYAISAAVERVRSGSSGPCHWIVAGERRIPLNEGENAIGRAPDATVWLDFAGISRRHARIIISGASVFLEDLGSKNGTRVAGQPVNGRSELRDGDAIHIASIRVAYRRSISGLSTETESRRVARRSTAPRTRLENQ
jgi:DNA-binding winged helix-turn-helix (wHTH) protein